MAVNLFEKINNFKTPEIKNLIIEKRYTPSSKTAVIKNSVSGIDVSVTALNKMRALIKQDSIKSYSEYFSNFSSCLNIDNNSEVRWDLIIDKRRNLEYREYLKKELQDSKNLITSYYADVFKQRKRVYENLHSVKDKSGTLPTPVYNHCSVTGRTSITAGPNFMTMKKQDRKLLRSTKDTEVLIEIDVKSCEPSLYLKYLGMFSNEVTDVYDDIKSKLNLPNIPRDKFKRGILSILYGANERTSKNILKCSGSDIRKIRSFFKIEELTEALTNQFKEKNYIYNYYGRPICSDANLVNYWIQSSAVDYCSLGFANLIKAHNLKPCYFIHDSMTVAVNRDQVEDVLKIEKVYDPISKVSIHVETNLLS